MKKSWHPMRLAIWSLFFFVLAAGGCSNKNHDPLEKVNRLVDNLNNFVDRAVVRDVAMAYEKNVSGSVRDGVDNFFTNLGYLNVILNDHLQGRFAQGWRDTERLAINSTIGVLGVFDPATGMGRPRERNDFGITLGRWGFGSGPYLVLPILGPSSVRDAPAIIVSRVTNPMFWLNPPLEVSLPMDAVSFVDQRARLQSQIDVRDRAALDPYTFTRDIYLRHRASRIGGTTEEAYNEEGELFYDTAPQTVPGATDYIR